MVMHFGELYHGMKGIVTYKLSGHELNPLAGLFIRGMPNVVRRTIESGPYWIPPILFGFTLMYLLEAKHQQNKRKNPKDYENDV